MQKALNPRVAFVLAGVAILASLAAFGYSIQTSIPARSQCPAGGIVHCVVPPPHPALVTMLSHPLVWVGCTLLVLGIASLLYGIISARRADHQRA